MVSSLITHLIKVQQEDHILPSTAESAYLSPSQVQFQMANIHQEVSGSQHLYGDDLFQFTTVIAIAENRAREICISKMNLSDVRILHT